MNWNISPILFEWGPITFRWYGLLFMFGFLVSYFILKKIFERERVAPELLDQLFVYVFLGTVIGARLGHVLFYEPQKYLADPLEIFAFWHGGLASHGGAIGIVIALFLFLKRHPDLERFWIFDRIALVVPLAGAFIRFGNLMNSEIIGKPTNLPWALTFTRIDSLPRHPAQIYEAVSYLAIFTVLLIVYSRQKSQHGNLFGWMLILVFSMRFLIEFLKESQVSFESKLPIDIGQILSLPFVLVGIYCVMKAYANSRIVKVSGDLKLKGIL